MKQGLLSAVLAGLVLAAPARAAEYTIDAGHSSVGFKVRHLVVGKTSGRFGKFEGKFSYDPKDVEGWRAEAVIDTASIDTGLSKRDDHLRNADFFDAAKFPKMSFVGRKVSGFKDGKGKLHGDLTMKGVTKPVVLDLELNGESDDPWGNRRVGFTAKGRVNRMDYGISWNKALDAGGVMVGEQVDIEIEIEGVSKK